MGRKGILFKFPGSKMMAQKNHSRRMFGHDHRFGQVGADSSARGRDFADESALANCNKKKVPVEAGRNDDQGWIFE